MVIRRRSRQEQAEEKAASLPKEEVEEKKMKVMVAVDQCDESFYALEWTLDNLFKFPAAAAVAMPPDHPNQHVLLNIVHVRQPFLILPSPPSASATNSPGISYRKDQEENAASVISRAVQMCKEKMIKAETLILSGDANLICHAAEEMQIDLLVVSSHGFGPQGFSWERVSDYCVHYAKCPVLTVKPPKELHK